MQSSSADIKLIEIMQFAEWIQVAKKAIEQRERVPESPKLDTGEVAGWIQAFRTLEDRLRESEQLRGNLESEMHAREAYVSHLTQQLHVSLAEAKSAQAISQELQHAVATYKETQIKIHTLAREMVRTTS